VREPLSVLENLKRQLGSDAFSAQYQQMPVPPGGAMIKRKWIERYVALRPREEWLTVLQSWDTANLARSRTTQGCGSRNRRGEAGSRQGQPHGGRLGEFRVWAGLSTLQRALACGLRTRALRITRRQIRRSMRFRKPGALGADLARGACQGWFTGPLCATIDSVDHNRRRQWVEIAIPADALYQHFLVTAERRFWRCVESGETPRPYGIEPPRPRIEAVRVVDMSGSNSWAEFAGLFCSTRSAFLDHERAKSELKDFMPEDVKEASGHGVRAKGSKSGSVSFDLLASGEGAHAAI
jgi:hypothetical protein